MEKTIGVVGLGLIGGSLAKALTKNTPYKVLGYDINKTAVSKAIEDNVIIGELNQDNLSQCDVVIIALYLNGTIDYIKQNASYFKKGSVVVDCCGVKQQIHDEIFELMYENSVFYIGGHPMAGNEFKGYEASKDGLFDNATMIICEDEKSNIVAIKAVEMLFLEMGFGKITLTTADVHDVIISFTSQMPHIVSNCYVKSDTASKREGFSAGSYRDLTRVARLNVDMWTELCMSNRECLIGEIDTFIKNLTEYSVALQNDDEQKFKQLLTDGVELKEKLG